MENVKIICFSDVHLLLHNHNEEKEKIEKLDIFFKKIMKSNIEKLIIAGDLFDVWFEYKTVIPKKYFYILHKLKLIQENSTDIIYIAGNHDFKFIDFFQKQLKAKVYFNSYEFTCGENKFFISHGDEYTSNDLRYHLLKSFLRNKFINYLFGFIHPDIGLGFGKWMSRSSKQYRKPLKRVKKHEKGMLEFAKKKIAQGFNYVIMGHIHKPQIVSFDNGKYVNLGDWIRFFSYLEIKEDRVEIKYLK